MDCLRRDFIISRKKQQIEKKMFVYTLKYRSVDFHTFEFTVFIELLQYIIKLIFISCVQSVRLLNDYTTYSSTVLQLFVYILSIVQKCVYIYIVKMYNNKKQIFDRIFEACIFWVIIKVQVVDNYIYVLPCYSCTVSRSDF